MSDVLYKIKSGINNEGSAITGVTPLGGVYVNSDYPISDEHYSGLATVLDSRLPGFVEYSGVGGQNLDLYLKNFGYETPVTGAYQSFNAPNLSQILADEGAWFSCQVSDPTDAGVYGFLSVNYAGVSISHSNGDLYASISLQNSYIRFNGRIFQQSVAVNAAAIYSQGYLLNAGDVPMLDMTGTWNTSSTPTLLKFNVVDTASNASSLLMDLRVNSVSQFNVSKIGNITIPAGRTIGNSTTSFAIGSGNFYPSGSSGATSTLGTFTVPFFGIYLGASSASSLLTADAADVLALRRTTNPQAMRLFNTYTSGSGTNASNNIIGEWLATEWASNVAWITTRKGTSGGTGRDLVLGTDGIETLRLYGANRNALFAGNISCGIVTSTGYVEATSADGFRFTTGGSRIVESSDGVLRLRDSAGTSFGRLQFGGTTSSFPSIKRNSAAINFRLADDSADADITAAAATFSGAVTPATLTDAAAPNDSIYYSSTAGKLVYKDSGGVVNNLY